MTINNVESSEEKERVRDMSTWYIYMQGDAGGVGRYLGTVTALDQLDAIIQGRRVFGCRVYAVQDG